MEDNQYTIREHICMLYRGYKMLFSFSKNAMVWRSINAVFQQISPYFVLYMSSLIINQLINGKSFRYLMTLAIITVGGRFAFSIVENFINRIAEKTDTIMWNIHDLYYMEKQNNMDYKYLDDADITLLRMRIQNASNWGGNGFMQLYWSWWFILSSIMNIAMSTALTISLFVTFTSNAQSGFFAFVNSYWASIVVIVFIITNVIISSILANKSSDYSIRRANELSKMYQSSNGYWNTSMGRDSKIFGLGDIALVHIRKANAPEYRSETATHLFHFGVVKTIMAATMNCILYLFVGAKAYMGIIGIGNIVLYLGTVQKFIDAWGILSWRISRMFKNNAYMRDVFEFFDLPEEKAKGDIALIGGELMDIEFRNVSFKYPKTENYVLRNVSCTFKAGEKIAIVGCNGSGKTTLIKLLCRLYEPSEGEILLGGVPISQYRYHEYINALSVVFQDYYIFAFTISENVSVGASQDVDKVRECIEKVGLRQRIDETPNGIDSLIGGWYDTEGIQLSGGETQKLAIARAIFKDSPIVILDEPTASLDPLAESEIYSQFNSISAGKTAIYISHRLSSCRFCDKVAVFDNGELVQLGSHDQLVCDENGKYHELWNAQAQYYSTT